MSEHTDRRRRTVPIRVTLTSLLVASGIGVIGVVPAVAADRSPSPASFDSGRGHDRDDDRGHHRWFRDRGDVRYVWFQVCEGTAAGATTTTTTAPAIPAIPAAATTETVAPDAIAAAVEGAAVETAADTATPTDTIPTGTTTTETTPTETTPVDEDDPDAEAYPTFIVVPLPKAEAKALRKLDDRPCYDLTTGAPQATDTTTTTTTGTVTTDTTPAETTTATPVDTVTG